MSNSDNSKIGYRRCLHNLGEFYPDKEIYPYQPRKKKKEGPLIQVGGQQICTREMGRAYSGINICQYENQQFAAYNCPFYEVEDSQYYLK
jgi:hypothetical protein